MRDVDAAEPISAASFEAAIAAFEERTPLLRNVLFERQSTASNGLVTYAAPSKPNKIQFRLAVQQTNDGRWSARTIVICPS